MSLSLLSYTLSLSLLLPSISCFQVLNISRVYFVYPTPFFHFLGRPVISLFIFTGVFTNFPSISSLSVALNPFSCVLRVFFCSFFGFKCWILFVAANFYWVIVWALGFYALLIIYCQLSGRGQQKPREWERESQMPPTCLLFNISVFIELSPTFWFIMRLSVVSGIAW